MGSASELQHHLLLARDLEYLDAQSARSYGNRAEEVKKMLNGLAAKVRTEN